MITDNNVQNSKLADMAAYTIKLRNASSTGDPGDVKVSALTEETAPADDDWLLAEAAGGSLRKTAIGRLMGKPAGAEDITGTAYTIALADRAKFKRTTNAAAVTITIPANATTAFPVGSAVHIKQHGAGQITVQGAGGVTVNSTATTSPTTPKARTKHAVLALIKEATDEWVVSGEIDTA